MLVAVGFGFRSSKAQNEARGEDEISAASNCASRSRRCKEGCDDALMGGSLTSCPKRTLVKSGCL
jgi:hypothetical protein